MLIAGFPSAVTDTNCWVVAPGAGEQCVVIDPGIGVGAQLDEVIAEHRLHPVAVLLTHGHFDHTFSVLPVCQARDVPAYIHPADRAQLADPWSGVGMPVGTPLFGSTDLRRARRRPRAGRRRQDLLAGLDFAVPHAPGHTPGSVVFGLPGESATSACCSPATCCSPARSAASTCPADRWRRCATSLREVILPMDDATVVHPGHGPSTTIARERATNPYLLDLQ